MADRRTVLKELDFPLFWSPELIKKWERKESEEAFELEARKAETPVVELDLSSERLGKILLKNEGDTTVNRTGTMKDRLGRAYARVYRDQANYLAEAIENDSDYAKNAATKHLQRFSIITSGNAGMALAEAFAQEELPPPKILLDKHTSANIIEKLLHARADTYLSDLSINPFSGKPSSEDPLSPKQILELTNNEGGYDITSASAGELDPSNPGIVAYAGLADEIFTHHPDEIYVPYGSGMVFEGIVLGQGLQENASAGTANVFGAEPENLDSMADKLTAPAKPFKYYTPEEIENYKKETKTGLKTGVYKISEKNLKDALRIIATMGDRFGIRAEPSAVAGLALYIKRWKQNSISPDAKILVLNTGKGLEIESR